MNPWVIDQDIVPVSHPTCGEMVSMHERDSTNDAPCVLPDGHKGDCSIYTHSPVQPIRDWQTKTFSQTNGGSDALYICPLCGACCTYGSAPKHIEWHGESK